MIEWSGVFHIMATPFTDGGELDTQELPRLVDAALATGITGLTLLGIAGEAHRLTDEERRRVVEGVVKEVRGRVPVVVGVSASGTHLATSFTRMAQEHGANGLMVAPPTGLKNLDAVAEYYRTVAAAASVPLVLQDEPVTTQVTMPAAFMARLCGEIPAIEAVKLEEAPTLPKITRIRDLLGRRVAIFGGLGGVYFFEELSRGADGAMTGFPYPEALKAIRDHFVAGRRDEAFLVSKVLPENATRKGTLAACERSLKRLRTDRIDLYLLHWRGSVPFAETIEAFVALKKAGKIRHYGVSNLDISDMRELWKLRAGGMVAANQLLYNLTRRGIEWDLLPWLRERRVPVMAYSPVEQARLLEDARLAGFAQRNGMTPAQAALSWLRSHASDLGIRSDFWDTSDIHIHIPAGAIPKDGPSAGVTMVTALASLMGQRPVKPRLAMTGEITLSGRVLAVGGIKEKVLAARRAGVTTVILPRRNERNLLEDVPKPLRESMTFHLVDSVEEVLDLALEDALPRGGRIKDALLASRN